MSSGNNMVDVSSIQVRTCFMREAQSTICNFNSGRDKETEVV